MENCSICMDTLLNEEKLFCGHSFCKECIGEWLSQNHGCPLCRRDPVINSLEKIAKKTKKGVFELYVDLRTFPWYEHWLNRMADYVDCDWIDVTPKISVTREIQRDGKPAFMFHLPWYDYICDAGDPWTRRERGAECLDPNCLCKSTVHSCVIFEGSTCCLNDTPIRKGTAYRMSNYFPLENSPIVYAHGQILGDDIFLAEDDDKITLVTSPFEVGQRVQKKTGVDKECEGVVIFMSKDLLKIRVRSDRGRIWNLQSWRNFLSA